MSPHAAHTAQLSPFTPCHPSLCHPPPSSLEQHHLRQPEACPALCSTTSRCRARASGADGGRCVGQPGGHGGERRGADATGGGDRVKEDRERRQGGGEAGAAVARHILAEEKGASEDCKNCNPNIHYLSVGRQQQTPHFCKLSSLSRNSSCIALCPRHACRTLLCPVRRTCADMTASRSTDGDTSQKSSVTRALVATWGGDSLPGHRCPRQRRRCPTTSTRRRARWASALCQRRTTCRPTSWATPRTWRSSCRRRRR